MKRIAGFFILMLALSIQCFSQIRKDEDSTALGVCWSSDLDTTARYLVYYRYYQQGPDSTWYYLGITKLKEYYIPKGILKGKLAVGVRSVWNSDTSQMHASLDSTACATGNVCGDVCTQGAWYVDWHIKKPKNINAK
jgi:hypothetical protein